MGTIRFCLPNVHFAVANTPQALTRNNTTMVPLRYIAEWLGATVEYTGQPRQITVNLNNKTVKIKMDSKMGFSDGTPIRLTGCCKIQ